MSKSIFILAAAMTAIALAPVGGQSASAAGLPSLYDSYSDHDLEIGSAEASPSDGPLASGRVVAIDPAAGKITLDYRPLPLLPEGGVRIFSVEDPSLLKGLSAGDRVRFEVERDGRRYVLRHLENSN
jgi:Cu(I)/Ag(I) efflux system protein CusF